jgi:peptide/nickel transport system permease protein
MSSSDAGSLPARPGAATRSQSYLKIVVRQFAHNRAAVVGMGVISIFVLMATLAPDIAPYDPNAIDLANRLKGPSAGHWLGTDELGRDMFSRIIIGARITLLITGGAMGLAVLLGASMGVLAGYYGGYVDTVVSRFVDILMTMPSFLLAVAIVAALGVGTANVIIAIGIAAVPDFARIARASTLSVRAEEYIFAARSIGVRPRRLILRHIAPNIVPPLMVQATMRLATAILSASSLSFLGLGPQPPTPEWGAMMSTGRNYVSTGPLLVVFPGLAILLVALSFNLMGDGLRDALDPRLRS